MRKSKRISFFAACLGMGLLILDSRTALKGTMDGVTLALTVLIPSLFPFLFLSIALADSFQEFQPSFLKPIGKLFRVPVGMETLLLTAFLGGYPAGAQAVCQAYHSGRLSKENSEKMLAFCNNAGPSFLFGMASACFSERRMVWALWGLHILGAIAAAQVFPCTLEMTHLENRSTSLSLTGILKQALTVMSVICGWVVLFRVLIAFADRWFLWLVPAQVRVGIIGFLELSNGICELKTIADEKVRFLVCSGMLSLGGLCVTLQTSSVTEGLSKGYYFQGKIIQLLISICCGAAMLYHVCFLIPVFLIPWLLMKNRSGNPAAAGV